MTNKQTLSLNRKDLNLCEIDSEFPSLKGPAAFRHLGTDAESKKTVSHSNINAISIRSLNGENNLEKKDLKTGSNQSVEIIDLFRNQQETQINSDKLYKKSRRQLRSEVYYNDDNNNHNE